MMDKIYQEIMEDELNRAYTERGVPPLFKAPKEATMAIIGQAPGRKAEETQLFWKRDIDEYLRLIR